MLLKSNESYSAGDVILSLKPIVFIVSAKSRLKRCNYCLAICNALKACSGCRYFQYCSQGCQKKDWKSFHKQECRVFKKAKETSSPFLSMGSELLMLRVYLTFKAHPELLDLKYRLPDGLQLCFNDLMSNLEAIKQDEERMTKVTGLQTLLREIIPDFDEESFFLVYGRVCTNSYGLEEEFDTDKIGHVLLIDAAAINHSCRPNAFIMSCGLNIELRALESISAGEEITVSYIGLVKSREHRRQELKSNWYFDCFCRRCCIEDDDVVDQIEMKEREICQRVCDSTTDEMSKFHDLFFLILDFIRLHILVLHDHHPLITRLLFRASKARLNANPKFSDKESLNSVFKRFETEILVTHGKHHPMYKQFEDMKEISFYDFLLQEAAKERKLPTGYQEWRSSLLCHDKWGAFKD